MCDRNFPRDFTETANTLLFHRYPQARIRWRHVCVTLFPVNSRVMHQSIPAAPIPPRANPRALVLFLFWVANSRGWG